MKAECGEQELARLPGAENCDANCVVVIKDDRMYLHQIFRVNYTAYDVRRLQDIINAQSTHCNIMVLCQPDDNSSSHFRYGRVLGTYHTKAIYTGPGSTNYHSHTFEFLWIRWYNEVEEAGAGWNSRRLHRVRFAPLDGEDAFDIVDPADILRGCHIIPRFSLGKRYLHSGGLSALAHDSSDWMEYYVNR